MGTASEATIVAELAASKEKLERELGREIQLFAYPFGGPNNITDAARRLVEEAGFQCCLSCHSGTNPRVADPYHLQRLPISTWYAAPMQMTAELVFSEARTSH
jgi:peptidoglycan/xylan/chitin deacetylase (PgdA/CDA1 family)